MFLPSTTMPYVCLQKTFVFVLSYVIFTYLQVRNGYSHFMDEYTEG